MLKNLKHLSRNILCGILENQARKLRARHQFKLVAVAGSVGKTSTKLAIAKTLSATQRVIYQEGNYNARLTVPLTLFGHNLPGLFNIFAWIKILLKNRRIIAGDFPYDFAVLELGTDHPGEIAKFDYLKPDLAVISAVKEEHMQFFKTLDAVAREELTVFDYSKLVLVNIDDTSPDYLRGRDYKSYGMNDTADYKVHNVTPRGLSGSNLTIDLAGKQSIEAELTVLGSQGAKLSAAAAAVADIVGLTPQKIKTGLLKIQPFAGRMTVLNGIKGSKILDDSYNASPISVKAALDVLYAAGSNQRIAILGSMNELGEYSPKAHLEVGSYCDPKRLDLIVTIGSDANRYLAEAAEKAGCYVERFPSPIDAGDFVANRISSSGAVILVKGSETGVFAEEAIKPLLANKDDAKKLVRQSDFWLNKKRKSFPNIK